MSRTLISFVFALCLLAEGAVAQAERWYIQVEARTSLAGAQASVRGFTGRMPNVNGFALGGGWYGVALGPYASRGQAESFLGEMLRSGAVPPDSYVESGSSYGQQFWPVGAGLGLDQGTPDTEPVPDRVEEPVAATGTGPAETAPEAVAAPAPLAVPEETPGEARASERQLTRDERDALQIALQWAGFYDAAIDGAFGPGTRRAMADWQAANALEPTGVLTTRQRAELLRQYNAVLDGMGMRPYTDPRAGIRMEMPLGVVAFDRYEAPFALFDASTELGVQVLLISQPGDRNTLNGLYEIMQTLEIVPIEGERERRASGFLLTGANSRIVSHTEVGLEGGEIKGFTLVWPAGDEERRTRVLGLIQESFARTAGVLDPAAVTDDGQSVDLVSGLRVRTPQGTGSGFFVESSGTVLTSSEAVASCERVTLDGVYNARVVARDAGLGVAILRPEQALAPRRVAQFNAGAQRIQSEVAVAGFSFGGVLGAPSLTFGTLEDLRGLGGEENLTRLALAAQPGDAGGPVFDAGGTVTGMLLPRQEQSGRMLPDEVSFAAKGEAILGFLRANGVQPLARGGGAAMAPEDLTALAADTTVLVSCW